MGRECFYVVRGECCREGSGRACQRLEPPHVEVICMFKCRIDLIQRTRRDNAPAHKQALAKRASASSAS